jgi:hypothetical protein
MPSRLGIIDGLPIFSQHGVRSGMLERLPAQPQSMRPRPWATVREVSPASEQEGLQVLARAGDVPSSFRQFTRTVQLGQGDGISTVGLHPVAWSLRSSTGRPLCGEALRRSLQRNPRSPHTAGRAANAAMNIGSDIIQGRADRKLFAPEAVCSVVRPPPGRGWLFPPAAEKA